MGGLTDIIGLIGVGAGLIGVFAGVAAVFWGLGVKEYLGGKKRMPVGYVDKESLKKKLLALNSPDAPYELQPFDETDLVLTWKIVDAKWFAVFAKERLKQTYRAFIVLDEMRRSVRYCEEFASVRWIAGSEGLTPHISYQSEFFRGRILFQKSWNVQYGIKEDLTIGKVFQYSFDIRDVRDPVKHAILESGWEFVPVVRKAHATYRSLKAY
ncbi:MAG: hypothetical protein PHR56_05475 [Dehalococcoidales bacterium]|nr:hypothetical protein [Dehalococcoidales bacterium]